MPRLQSYLFKLDEFIKSLRNNNNSFTIILNTGCGEEKINGGSELENKTKQITTPKKLSIVDLCVG